MKPIEVIFLHRKPRHHGTFSIEFIFQDIRRRLPRSIHSMVKVSKYPSNGIWKRIYNLIEAATCRADVKHITGDVHYLALLLKKSISILTIHDCYLLYLKKGLAKWFYKTFWFDLPVRRVGKVVAISEATKAEIVKFTGCKPEKITIIPTIISEQFKAFSKPFSIGKPVILHVGLAPNKNFDRTVEALEGIKCHFKIIGRLTPKHESKLRQHDIDYSTLYNISDEEMVRAYEECDLLCFASTYEGFGMPILEAQAIGRPVITSNCSSMPEVAGDAAILIDPFNVQSIREGILKLINDENLRNKLVAAGYENCRRFDPNKVAQQYAALYHEMAGSPVNEPTPCAELQA